MFNSNLESSTPQSASMWRIVFQPHSHRDIVVKKGDTHTLDICADTESLAIAEGHILMKQKNFQLYASTNKRLSISEIVQLVRKSVVYIGKL